MIRTTGAADRKIIVDAYPAQDGLCLKALEPNETSGSSIACVNPAQAPYTGPRAFGIALMQRRASGTTVLGLTSSDAATVEFRDRQGKPVSVPTRALAPELSASRRLRVIVADLPPAYSPVSASARDASGHTLAVVDLTRTDGGGG